MHGISNMQSALYRHEMSMIADQRILWAFIFNSLLLAPSPICHLSIRSDGLTSECLCLDVKVLWEGTSWRQPSKMSSSGSLILVASGTLVSEIPTCDSSCVSIKDGFCLMSCSPGSILVSWNFLRNTSTKIATIPANYYPSSLLGDPFVKRKEWGYQSCWDVRIIQGKSYNFFCVGDEV